MADSSNQRIRARIGQSGSPTLTNASILVTQAVCEDVVSPAIGKARVLIGSPFHSRTDPLHY